MRKNVNIALDAIAATTVFSASGVESSMSKVDILAGRSLSDFVCRNALPETVAETFSLTNGVLTANAVGEISASVLEVCEMHDGRGDVSDTGAEALRHSGVVDSRS